MESLFGCDRKLHSGLERSALKIDRVQRMATGVRSERRLEFSFGENNLLLSSN